MAKRVDLQTKLEEILGSENVYFQPPSSVHMKYPAIVYSLARIENTFANNHVYRQDTAYEIVVIDRDPDGDIYKRISVLPKCRFDRHYVADNLNHYTFTLYY